MEKIKTLADFFRVATLKYAKNTALLYRPRFRTLFWRYEELRSHALLFAKILKEQGVKKGDRVIILSQNSPFWVAGFFGIQLTGAIAVPLSPESNQKLVEEICRQTSPKLIFRGAIAVVKAAPGYKFLQLEEIEKPEVSKVYSPGPKLSQQVKENDVAEIVYTSGTTGFPKGVMLTHKNLLSNLAAVKKVIKIDSSFKFASILPLFHMFEQMGGMLAPLSAGAQISYAASLNPNHLKRIFQDDRTNIMLVVPEFLRLMRLRIKEKAEKEGKLIFLEKMLKGVKFLPMWLRRKLFASIHRAFGWRVHTFVSGGAPLEKEVSDFWERLGVYVLQGYGLTETSPVLSVNQYRDRKINSAGRPLENVEIKIAKDGEVLARGLNIFSGYWLDKQKTKEAFIEDGWFKTGDIGYLDKDGHLFLKGRKKDVIVLPTGEKVHPEDLEQKLNKEPEVVDSAVLGIEETGRVRVRAILLLKTPTEKTAGKIIKRVNQKLMPYQQIKGWSLWPYDDFPRTPTRKIKKYEVLQELKKLRAEKPKKIPLPSASSKVEMILAQVAGVSPDKISDSQSLVKDLNMDSLARIELVARIETHLNVSVDESEITDKTTVADIKELVFKKRQKQVKYEFRPELFSLPAVVLRAVLQPLILKPLAWLFAPMEKTGMENLKKAKKPVILFSNHLSTADGAVILASLPGKIRRQLVSAAATDVLFEKPEFGWRLLRFLAENLYLALPFARQGQIKSSLEHIGRALDKGYSVLVFPEGNISPNGSFQELKKGAALLAKEMAVSIIPVKLEGTRAIIDVTQRRPGQIAQFPRRAKVSVSFGEPFSIPKKMPDDQALKEIETKMRNVGRDKSLPHLH